MLPLFHIFRMIDLMNGGVDKRGVGILIIFLDTAIVFTFMQQYAVTFFINMHSMYWWLLNYTDVAIDFMQVATNLKLYLSGKASLLVHVLQDFEKRFYVPIIKGNGMSEGLSVATFNDLNSGRKSYSINKPNWRINVKLVEVNGEEVFVGEKGNCLTVVIML